MRQSVAIGQIIPGKTVVVLGIYGPHNYVLDCIRDRKADGDAFPAETAVRLPRRLQIDSYDQTDGLFFEK